MRPDETADRTHDSFEVTPTAAGGSAAAALADARWWIAALVLWVVASRLPYVGSFVLMGKDGVFYVDALKLDRSYNVPPPGNLGFVLLGKLASQFIANPVHAYAAVTIALSALGVVFVFLLADMVLPRPLAAATAFALSCNSTVWWHGTVITSYLTWLAVLPAIGWFGVRYVRHHRFNDLIAASVALGVGTMLRQDLLASGTPLWLGCLVLGRAPWRGWVIGGLIVGVACVCWFFGTAAILGGADVYLERVRAQRAIQDGYSAFRNDLVEGLFRNGLKYGLYVGWSAAWVLPFFVIGVGRSLRSIRTDWRALVLAALWVGPSFYFAFLIFAGNAGLIFPFLPWVYLGAARGVQAIWQRRGRWTPALAMLLLAALSIAQFNALPLLKERDQRQVILNVTFLKYTGAGLRERYNYDLVDYRIGLSLRSVARQVRDPEPIPHVPNPNF